MATLCTGLIKLFLEKIKRNFISLILNKDRKMKKYVKKF